MVEAFFLHCLSSKKGRSEYCHGRQLYGTLKTGSKLNMYAVHCLSIGGKKSRYYQGSEQALIFTFEIVTMNLKYKS